MKTLLLSVLTFLVSTHAHAYSEEELKALAEREHAMMQSPPPQNWGEVWIKQDNISNNWDKPRHSTW